ncbi:YdeI/OmpD-associated family protein [Demequina sediminicola]|uniref:YdeI/OmpD-associated family protein n=1 Tax=Demequina sediminicola TaxID=1095026 RepID=UPI000B2E0E0C|nr:YdeI/OmpD-associated family protein [Demequina sediminicola]
MRDEQSWHDWLVDNDAVSNGVWLVLAKKGVTEPTSLAYAQALDEALCSGWIDGQRRSRDSLTFVQRFTPRRPRSLWSKRNVEHVARLTEAGRMRAGGQRQVELARADGRWERAYPGSADAVAPDDLVAALAALPDAQGRFAALSAQQRFAMLHPLITAATPETRARRLERLIERLKRES